MNADFANAITKLVPNNLRRRWSDAKVAKKDFSCSTFMLYLGVEGKFEHLAHSFAQMLHLCPQNRCEEFDGMYLVGGGTHPGSGLPVIFESARISSKLVLEDLGLAA